MKKKRPGSKVVFEVFMRRGWWEVEACEGVWLWLLGMGARAQRVMTVSDG